MWCKNTITSFCESDFFPNVSMYLMNTAMVVVMQLKYRPVDVAAMNDDSKILEYLINKHKVNVNQKNKVSSNNYCVFLFVYVVILSIYVVVFNRKANCRYIMPKSKRARSVLQLCSD